MRRFEPRHEGEVVVSNARAAVTLGCHSRKRQTGGSPRYGPESGEGPSAAAPAGVASDRLKALFSSKARGSEEEPEEFSTSKALRGESHQGKLSPEDWARSLFGQDVNTRHSTAASCAEEVPSSTNTREVDVSNENIASERATSLVRLSLPEAASRIGLKVQRFERSADLQEVRIRRWEFGCCRPSSLERRCRLPLHKYDGDFFLSDYNWSDMWVHLRAVRAPLVCLQELAAWRRQRAVMRIDCLRQHKTARRKKAKHRDKDGLKV